MSFPIRAGLRRPAAITIATVAVTAMTMATATYAEAGPTGAKAAQSSGVYLVQFDAAPLATYTGGVSGIAGTKPAAGAKLDPKSWNYNAYREHIRKQRQNVLSKAKVDRQEGRSTTTTT